MECRIANSLGSILEFCRAVRSGAVLVGKELEKGGGGGGELDRVDSWVTTELLVVVL